MRSIRRLRRGRRSSTFSASRSPTNTSGAPSIAGTGAALSVVSCRSARLPEAGDWLAAVPERFRSCLAKAVAGTLPANVALMQLLAEATDRVEAGAVLRAAREAIPRSDGPERRLEAVAK